MRILSLPGAKFIRVAYLDGQRLLTRHKYGGGSNFRVWDLATNSDGRDVGLLGWEAINSLFLADSQRYLRHNGLWDDAASLPAPAGPHRILVPPHPLVPAYHWWPAAFRADGSAAVFVESHYVQGVNSFRFHFRDADGGVRPLYHVTPGVHSCAAFSPGGGLVAASGGDQLVVLFDVATWQQVLELEQSDRARLLVFTAEDHLAVCAGRTVRVWHLPSRRTALKLPTFQKFAVTASVSPDRSVLAVGSRDGQVGVWETATGKCRGLFDWNIGEIHAVAFSPDGSTAAAAGESGVVIWDID